MKKADLTLDYIEKYKLSPTAMVKHFKPDWTDWECNTYLWEHTDYPDDMEMTVKQLNTKLK